MMVMHLHARRGTVLAEVLSRSRPLLAMLLVQVNATVAILARTWQGGSRILRLLTTRKTGAGVLRAKCTTV